MHLTLKQILLKWHLTYATDVMQILLSFCHLRMEIYRNFIVFIFGTIVVVVFISHIACKYLIFNSALHHFPRVHLGSVVNSSSNTGFSYFLFVLTVRPGRNYTNPTDGRARQSYCVSRQLTFVSPKVVYSKYVVYCAVQLKRENVQPK